MPSKDDELAQEVLESIAPLMQHVVQVDPGNKPRITSYCNLCDHEIERCGNDWQCVNKPPCRCLMMGCIPKVWNHED